MPRSSSGRIDQGGTGGTQFVALAARVAATTTYVSPDLTVEGLSYAAVTIDVTAAGTGSVGLIIEGKDPASGKYFTLGVFNTITTITTDTVLIGPGTVTTGTSVMNYFNGFLPAIWRIRAVHANANPMDYTIGYSLVW